MTQTRTRKTPASVKPTEAAPPMRTNRFHRATVGKAAETVVFVAVEELVVEEVEDVTEILVGVVSESVVDVEPDVVGISEDVDDETELPDVVLVTVAEDDVGTVLAVEVVLLGMGMGGIVLETTSAAPFPMVFVAVHAEDAGTGCARGVVGCPWKKVDVP